MANNQLLIQGLIELHLKGEGGEQAVASMKKIIDQAKQVQKETGGIDESLKKAGASTGFLSNQMAQLGSVVAGAFAVGRIAAFTKDSFLEFAKLERAFSTMRSQIMSAGQSLSVFESMKESLRALGKETGDLDATLIPAFNRAMLTFGNAKASLEAVTIAAKFADAGFGDLEGNTQALALAIQSGMSRSLRVFGIETKDAEGKALDLGVAFKELKEKSEAFGHSDSAQDRLEGWARLSETVKQTTGGMLEGLFKSLDQWKEINKEVTDYATRLSHLVAPPAPPLKTDAELARMSQHQREFYQVGPTAEQAGRPAGPDVISPRSQAKIVEATKAAASPEETGIVEKAAARQREILSAEAAAKAKAEDDAERKEAERRERVRQAIETVEEKILRNKIEFTEKGSAERIAIELELNDRIRDEAIKQFKSLAEANVEAKKAELDKVSEAKIQRLRDEAKATPGTGPTEVQIAKAVEEEKQKNAIALARQTSDAQIAIAKFTAAQTLLAAQQAGAIRATLEETPEAKRERTHEPQTPEQSIEPVASDFPGNTEADLKAVEDAVKLAQSETDRINDIKRQGTIAILEEILELTVAGTQARIDAEAALEIAKIEADEARAIAAVKNSGKGEKDKVAEISAVHDTAEKKKSKSKTATATLTKEQQEAEKARAIDATRSALAGLSQIFAKNKTVAIGLAIIDTALAVMQAWANEKNVYVAIARTVVAIAVGAAQIASIKSATEDGGGNITSGVAAAPTASGPPPSQASYQGQTPAGEVRTPPPAWVAPPPPPPPPEKPSRDPRPEPMAATIEQPTEAEPLPVEVVPAKPMAAAAPTVEVVASRAEPIEVSVVQETKPIVVPAPPVEIAPEPAAAPVGRPGSAASTPVALTPVTEPTPLSAPAVEGPVEVEVVSMPEVPVSSVPMVKAPTVPPLIAAAPVKVAPVTVSTTIKAQPAQPPAPRPVQVQAITPPRLEPASPPVTVPVATAPVSAPKPAPVPTPSRPPFLPQRPRQETSTAAAGRSSRSLVPFVESNFDSEDASVAGPSSFRIPAPSAELIARVAARQTIIQEGSISIHIAKAFGDKRSMTRLTNEIESVIRNNQSRLR